MNLWSYSFVFSGVTWIRRISADLIHFFVSNKEEKNLISICETIANLGESCGLENPLLFRIEKDKQFAELLTANVLNSLKNPDQENSSSKDVLTLLLSMNYMAPLDDKVRWPSVLPLTAYMIWPSI